MESKQYKYRSITTNIKENNEIIFHKEEFQVKSYIVKAWYDIDESREGEWKIAKDGNKSNLSGHDYNVN